MARFVELGGKVMDTAMIYGTSEAVIGEIAQGLDIRDQLFFATKTDIRGQLRGEHDTGNGIHLWSSDRCIVTGNTVGSGGGGIRADTPEELAIRIVRHLEELNQEPVAFRWKYRLDQIEAA